MRQFYFLSAIMATCLLNAGCGEGGGGLPHVAGTGLDSLLKQNPVAVVEFSADW